MSKFKQATKEVDSLEDAFKQLDPTLKDLPIETRYVTIKEFYEKYQTLKKTMDVWVKTAKETDEDKKIYNEKMTKNVLELAERFFATYQPVVSRYEEVMADFVPLEHAKLLAVQEKERKEREAEEAAEQKLQHEKRLANIAREKREKEEEKKQAESERQERERAAIDRELYEGELKAKEERKVRLEEATRRGVDLPNSLKFLRSNCSPAQFGNAVKIMYTIMSSVLDEPDNPLLRQIRVSNKNFQEDIAMHPGGEECLIALGFKDIFVMKDGVEVEHWCNVEPPMEDIEVWAAWFEKLKADQETLKTELQGYLH